MAMKAFYFPHDFNAGNDNKIAMMRFKYGNEGYGLYWLLIEMLYTLPEHKYSISGELGWESLSMQLHNTKINLKEFIEDCCGLFVDKQGSLFSFDGNYFWSDSLFRRMNKINAISEKRKNAIKKRWENANNADDTNVCKNDTNVCEIDTNVLKKQTNGYNCIEKPYKKIQNDTNKNKIKENKIKYKDKNKEKKEKREKEIADIQTEFEVYWKTEPIKSDKRRTEKNINKLIKDKKISIKELITYRQRYLEHAKKRTDKQYWKHPANFFGHDGTWEDWTEENNGNEEVNGYEKNFSELEIDEQFRVMFPDYGH